ncbi:MAG: cell division protein FtsW [Phycisphaerae bacterium]|nr:cell division protein FtsW [Phycisphaerae bacterium]
MLLSNGAAARRVESLIIVTVALVVIGLLAVMSATTPVDRGMFSIPIWRSIFGRQLIFAAGGLVLLAATARISPWILGRTNLCRALAVIAVLVAVGLLVATLIPGFAETRRNSQRWLQILPMWGGIGLQPSELAKLAMVAMLAALLSLRFYDVRSFFRGFLPAAGVIALCAALVGFEDFGTCALIFAVGFLTLFVAGCRTWHLALTGLVGAGGLAFLVFLKPYRVERLTSFLDLWADPRGSSYQPVQSLMSITSGGWLGSGIGAGVQKYGYVPDGHTDFIFSLICEETGIVGGGLILLLFVLFILVGWSTMRAARTPLERLLAFGLTAMIAVQALLNVAVVTVVAPTTGIPLPFISAGGSGLVANCFAVGVLVGIAARAGLPESEREELLSAYSAQPAEPARREGFVLC